MMVTVDNAVAAILANHRRNGCIFKERFQSRLIHRQKELSFRIDLEHSDRRLQRPKLFKCRGHCLCHRPVFLCSEGFHRCLLHAAFIGVRVVDIEALRNGKGGVQGRQACAVRLAEVRANNGNRRGANETCSALH